MPKRGRPQKKQDLSQQWESLALVHQQAGSLLRSIVVQRLEQVQLDIENGEKVWHTEIRSLGETLTRAIDIERDAVCMQWRDREQAVKTTEQLGFIVTLPEGGAAISPQYVQHG